MPDEHLTDMTGASQPLHTIPVDRLSVLNQTFVQVAQMDEAQAARNAIVYSEGDDQFFWWPSE